MPNQKQEQLSKETSALRLNLEAKYKFSKSWQLQLAPLLKNDFAAKDNDEKFLFEPEELNIQWRKSSQKIKVGYSRAIFEGTDFINPMDIVNPKNYQDPLKTSSRGSTGFFLSDQWASFSWDLIFIPQAPRSLMPSKKSPWWPRQVSLPLQTDELTLLLPESFEYEIKPPLELNKSHSNNAAIRLQYHGDNFDFSLAGFEGAAQTPLLVPTINVTPVQVYPKEIYQLGNPVIIEPVYYRHRVSAFASTLTLNSWILRFSGQHSQPIGDDLRLPGWSNYGVLAVEKTLNIFNKDLTLLLQSIQGKRASSSSLSLLSGLMENSSMLGLRFPFAETWIWNFAYFQEHKTQSYFMLTEILHNWSDHWRQSLEVTVLGGPAESTLGNFDKNDRALMKVSYLF